MLVDEQTSIVGSRLKHLRLLKALNLAELAKTAECSESFLSKIENGKAMPSLALLIRLAAALETTVSWIFTFDTQLRGVVLRKDERPSMDMERFRKTKGTSVERLTPVFQGQLMAARVFIIEPGGHTVGESSYSGEVLGYALEGEFELVVDGEKYVLQEGDAFHFRAEQPHGYHNHGELAAKIIWINTPPPE